MNAIRKIVEVKNHELKIKHPDSFDSEYAEVIIFPKEEESKFDISDEEKQVILGRIKNSDPTKFRPWRELREKYL
ncbi:hypothetical protein MTP09_00545 [Chryseobacterium suipulveris]|uniref:Uncharacterized protein n=1 Tax=Chryseobacterium suipulveris TaxID=2929800 RepID=A0ABY4BPQ8_9FLAO|nr:hypothetical protein [Chryseobacterium suipulveris]UOE41166.1 hypothetical protein MTP09_00545 [Chryseobacterium suipulveris]